METRREGVGGKGGDEKRVVEVTWREGGREGKIEDSMR